jgi:hypothetical protein
VAVEQTESTEKDALMAKGDGKNKFGHPLPYKPQPPLKNVCAECGYHASHSPTCSKNPNNRKDK